VNTQPSSLTYLTKGGRGRRRRKGGGGGEEKRGGGGDKTEEGLSPYESGTKLDYM
jgi:hypothetical protein